MCFERTLSFVGRSVAIYSSTTWLAAAMTWEGRGGATAEKRAERLAPPSAGCRLLVATRAPLQLAAERRRSGVERRVGWRQRGGRQQERR